MARRQPIELFMPPNMLKAKLGQGGFDNSALKRAETALAGLKGEFPAWMQDDVTALAQAAARFGKSGDAPARAALLRAAHDIKGQAASLGFPLMGRIAGSLSHLLGEARAALPAGLVDAHVAAVQVIFRQKIADPADKTALTLCAELEARVKEVLAN